MSVIERNDEEIPRRLFQRWNQDTLEALGSLLAGILVISVPVVGHLLSPIFAIPVAVLLAGLVANYAPRTAVISIFVALLFQNFFVSLVSEGLSGPEEFKIIRGYNFFVLFTIWLVNTVGYITRLRGLHKSIDKLMNATFLSMGIIFFYFAIGLAQNPTPAVIYLRNIMSPLMVFQVTLLVFWRCDFRLSAALFLITLIFILFGYLELLYRQEWLNLTGSKTYWDLETQKERLLLAWDKEARETGFVVTKFLDTITVDFFNTPLLGGLNVRVARLMGPNMHAISYSYAVAFLIIFALFRGAPLSALLLFPLLVFASAKGALIMLILVCVAWGTFKLLGARMSFYLLCLLLILYAISGILVGLSIGDFHVLGFMGGVHNFLQFPLGHGIGVGGNLTTDFSKLNWPEYQALGRTPVAIESAVGVLLFQMGPGTFVVLGLYAWVAWQTIRVGSFTGTSLHVAAGFTLLTVLVNGIFQEEALFSPLALGLLISLNGMILGQAIRRGFTI
ncbi:MAG: hypothetical protein K5905_00700 [Roseibium sp.]|uniref:hypothetical protein n=1 Tax=Roseibium sp. TaxID=1936156 RepID=UPI0026153930|nr:hypothetical protein [Roseibium sp.]MCV0423966.1 hypothetical protein [Roseibium sp.]